MNDVVDVDEEGSIKKDDAVIHLKTLKQFITNIIKLKIKKDKVLNSVNDNYNKLPKQIKDKFITDGFSYENLYKTKSIGLLKSGNTKKAEKIYKDFKETYLNESGIEDLTSLINNFIQSLENVEEEIKFSETEVTNKDIEPEVTTSKPEETEETTINNKDPESTVGGSKNNELDKELDEIKKSILEIVNKQKDKENRSESDNNTQIDKSSSSSESSLVKKEVNGEPISSNALSDDLVQAVNGIENAVRDKNNKSSMTKMMSNIIDEEKEPVKIDCPPPPDQKSITISAPAGFNISTEGGPTMDNKLSGVKAVLSSKKPSEPDQQGGKKSKKYRRFKLRKRTRRKNRMLNKKNN